MSILCTQEHIPEKDEQFLLRTLFRYLIQYEFINSINQFEYDPNTGMWKDCIYLQFSNILNRPISIRGSASTRCRDKARSSGRGRSDAYLIQSTILLTAQQCPMTTERLSSGFSANHVTVRCLFWSWMRLHKSLSSFILISQMTSHFYPVLKSRYTNR